MKRFKDVIARKRPAARAAEADDVETVKDFAKVLGQRQAARPRPDPARDAAQEELERRLMNGELPRSGPVEPVQRADIELDRLAPKDPPAPMDTFPERPAVPAPGPNPVARDGRTTAAGAGPTGNGPRIWDVEEPADTGRDAALQPRARTRQPARGQQPPQAAGSSGGGRVKTRILGFHADDLPPDVFSAQARPAVAPVRYPGGWLVVVEGPGRGHAFALAAGLSKIGRGTDQTISLDFGDTSVSRDNHAAIAFDEEENRFFIGHGGKSNIVRLNGRPVLSTEKMQDGDLVKIGRTTLRLVALCGPEFSWDARDGDDAEDA